MTEMPPPRLGGRGRPVCCSTSLLAAAELTAGRLAEQAGVTIRLLDSQADFQLAVGLLDEVWGNGIELISPHLMRALRHTDNYIAGAFHQDRLVGYCFGFQSVSDRQDLHSHIAAVVADQTGRSVGTALKFHQRAWCLRRDIRVIEWTFDPLIARNAAFNLIRLGAEAAYYLVNFYGEMNDAINHGEASDRLMARWYLDTPEVAAAGDGQRRTIAADAPVDWVEIPPDIEELRRSDPAAASHWRLRLRETLAAPLADGAKIIGYHPAKGYALERKESA